MCLKQTFDIAATLFVVYGTYLLSRQLFIEIVIEQFKRNLLNYKKYEDVPIFPRLAGLCYGFTKDNWINADTGIGSERPINKLSDPTAPFKGFFMHLYGCGTSDNNDFSILMSGAVLVFLGRNNHNKDSEYKMIINVTTPNHCIDQTRDKLSTFFIQALLPRAAQHGIMASKILNNYQ